MSQSYVTQQWASGGWILLIVDTLTGRVIRRMEETIYDTMGDAMLAADALQKEAYATIDDY